MPIRLLTRTARWKRGGLATRVALLSSMLAILVLLPALGLGYAALHSLIADKLASGLELTAIESRLRIESRIDALHDKIHTASRQSIFSNALADSAERNAYIRPLLHELCESTPEIDTLVLGDFEGKPLATGCQRHDADERWMQPALQAALAQGGPRVAVLEIAGVPHLDLAAPIEYLPTGSLEGGLWVQIDLTRLFEGAGSAGNADYHLQFLAGEAAAGTTRTPETTADVLRYRIPLAPRTTGALPLVLEVSVARDTAHRPLQLLVLGTLLIGLGAIALVSWQSRRIADAIASPLAELEATARRVAAGELDDIPSADVPAHEQDSFRLLAASVYRMIHALQDTQRELSETVDARTRQMRRVEADRLLKEHALASIDSGIVITDLTQPDNPIIYVNAAFERITGYAATEVLGRNCRLLGPHERDGAAIVQLRRAIASRTACSVVLRNLRKDGRAFWNQLAIAPVGNPDSGEIVHYVGVITDISERKANEDLLIDWLSRLDTIFTLSPDPLVCFDERGHLNYVNAAAERLFSQPPEPLISLTVPELEARIRNRCASARPYPGLPPSPDQATRPLADDADDPTQDCVIQLARPRPLTLHQTWRYCGNGGSSLVVYFRDVTREAELDRMKSEFLSTAAHELRTPMASIVGFSELLMTRRYDETRTRDLLGTIHRQANRLTALLGDLLDLSRIEARRAEGFHFERVPVRAAIDETLAAFLAPDTRHRLVADLDAAVPDLRADRAKFQQALLNLLSNAFKFSPAGGDVELRILPEHPEGRPLVGVSVRDHGIGMNDEARARAFERFFRSDRSGHIPGTGLGLSLVQEIMNIHGGRVDLDSEPDHGTCVTLWFPLADAGSVPIAEPAAAHT
ncbi:PAS/PAC sensor hybrid histidine kinase [Thauera phenylacetica B4P]|uniref:histidine kinase n=1 Tax=Thauera phenylacetica B4P TaxID=1234382 RepID=N6ZRB5_9RHOO|nr:ATP-binding protein [Thauera phenylacetica]ENO97052.1 PAS/PAC sensor hybrid histidine kinase [Thauera phenylacetica B4P]